MSPGSRAEVLGRLLLKRHTSAHAATVSWKDQCPHVTECGSREECEADKAPHVSPDYASMTQFGHAPTVAQIEARVRISTVKRELFEIQKVVQALVLLVPEAGLVMALAHTVALAESLATEAERALP